MLFLANTQHYLLCASVSVESSPHSYLLTSVTGRIPTPKCGTEPIRYVKPHFRDRRRLALSRYRNRAEITFLMCERKPYLGMVLLRRRESYPVPWDIVGTLRSNDADGNENIKKTMGFISKTITLHVQHAFLYISLPVLAQLRRKHA